MVVLRIGWSFQIKCKARCYSASIIVGYTTQEVKATSVMKVVLKDDTELLDEVVVVGYGAQKKVT